MATVNDITLVFDTAILRKLRRHARHIRRLRELCVERGELIRVLSKVNGEVGARIVELQQENAALREQLAESEIKWMGQVVTLREQLAQRPCMERVPDGYHRISEHFTVMVHDKWLAVLQDGEGAGVVLDNGWSLYRPAQEQEGGENE